MIVLLALVFTLVLAATGAVVVRAYLVSRPGPGDLGPVRGPAGAAQTDLFGGRGWAIAGCYSCLGGIILFLILLDIALLFLISVARS